MTCANAARTWRRSCPPPSTIGAATCPSSQARRFAQEEVAIVQGGAKEGQAFASAAFDHIVFTGSTNVGREVMKAAAERLTPVTLELGGKSQTIVTDDVDLALAADRIMIGQDRQRRADLHLP